jgi:uncharacterized membrane protein YvbJ
LLIYTCKICFNAFSEADKAWDKAVELGVCPKCGKKLEDFPVTDAEATQIRKTKQEVELQATNRNLDEQRQVKVGLYIFCLLFLLIIIFFGDSSFFEGHDRGKGKIIVGGIVGLVIAVSFIWKQINKR